MLRASAQHQLKPSTPLNCLSQSCLSLVTQVVVIRDQFGQRATDQGRRERFCTLWSELILAKIELQTRADVQPTVSKCKAHAACEGGVEADKSSWAGGQRTDVSEAMTEAISAMALAPSTPSLHSAMPMLTMLLPFIAAMSSSEDASSNSL